MSRLGSAATVLAFVLMSCAAALAGGLIPVHGFVLSAPRRGRVIVRLQPVVGMLRAGMYAVRATAKVPPPGTEVDALVVRRRNGLEFSGAPIPAPPFVAGTPNAAVKQLVGVGARVPGYTLVDQRGRPFRLDTFAGKVTVLSFIFTRCKDVCLTISSKFEQLQRLLDARDFHLVEVSIDPAYDSPAVLAAYGSEFGAKPDDWSLATVVIDRHGVVANVVESAGWDPSNLAATARAVAHLSSNPLRRFWFATFAQVSAFCGGNQSVAIVVMLSVIIPLIASITIPVLVWFGRRIFSHEEREPRPAP